MTTGTPTEISARAGKVHVVTKADVGMGGAMFVVGVFFNKGAAVDACKGEGTFSIMTIDPNRAYKRGSMLDVDMIENVTAASIRTSP